MSRSLKHAFVTSKPEMEKHYAIDVLVYSAEIILNVKVTSVMELR